MTAAELASAMSAEYLAATGAEYVPTALRRPARKTRKNTTKEPAMNRPARTPVPADLAAPAPEFKAPSDKSAAYLRSILTERVLPAKDGVDGSTRATRALAMLDAGQLSQKQVSRSIEAFKDCPRKPREQAAGSPEQARAALPEVPAGRYAVEEDGVLKFFRVDRPEQGRWAGYTFLKIQASDDLYPVKDYARKTAILAAIAEDPRAASIRYGHELGACGICGRTLTDEDSRAAGIGPVCARGAGW